MRFITGLSTFFHLIITIRRFFVKYAVAFFEKNCIMKMISTLGERYGIREGNHSCGGRCKAQP